MAHLVLIDGPNYVFRAFHAIRRLTNSEGLPTNAIFGYVQMLRAILKDLGPTHVAVAFDPKDGTFRNRIYPDYKAHRPPMPEDLVVQWPWIFEITEAFRLPLIQLEDHEADDVIATYVREARERGWEVSIVSTDKDLMQLVDDRVWLVDTMRNVHYGPEEVREKWGVGPERIRDLLALTGDSSDNIPGIPGIGPKTAAELLRQYGDLESVLRHAGDIRQPKRRENLLRHADEARLAYRLVGLDDHAPVPLPLEGLALRAPDAGRLAELFGRLEFRRLLDEFTEIARRGSEPSAPGEAQGLQVTTVRSPDAFDAMLAEIRKAELVAVDTETTSLATHDAEIVGIALSVPPGRAWYVPVGHLDPETRDLLPGQLSREEVFARLAPWLADPAARKCGHNLKYDLQVFRNAGLDLQGIVMDSMLLAYCLLPGQLSPRLDAVAEHYLGHRCTSYEEVAGKGAKQVPFSHVPIETAAPYAGEDAEVSLRLCRKLSAMLDEQRRRSRHDEIELPLMRVLADMEWKGAKLDVGHLARLSRTFGERIRELERAIIEAAGVEFNIHSPKQLGEVLFEHLRLPGGKRTKSGQWGTSQSVLERLAEKHEVPRLVLELRALAKLKSTYTDALPRLVHPETGRVHTSFNQAVTSTGRLSSSDPNLQNIPVRTREGREIRKAFIAERSHRLIAADYSQIELRLMAHFSQEPALIEAFDRGEDIHAATAARVHRIRPEEVTPEMRRQAKVINFGILYGMGAQGLARQLGIGRSEAKAFIETYFAQHPKVRAFMDETLERARAQGYVETLLGHRVLVPEINDRNPARRAYAERTAINAPLQGSAADIIKVAMIRLHDALKPFDDASIILQVHDELVIEAREADVNEITAIVRECMEHAASLSVPLTVDIGSGDNWLDARGGD